MSVVVSTFPSLNHFNSRSWTLAAIVALHAGFFWLLSSGGMSIVLPPPSTQLKLVSVESAPPPPPSQPTVIDDLTPLQQFIPVPPTPTTIEVPEDRGVIRGEPQQQPPSIRTAPTPTEPVIALPRVDPRFGLSEPPYPAAERRGGYEGTVLLAVEVLENGRVGEVRVEQSSGRDRLDQAALRQSRQWRFQPGTRDGVPIRMWKQIPVHFRLTSENQRF